MAPDTVDIERKFLEICDRIYLKKIYWTIKYKDSPESNEISAINWFKIYFEFTWTCFFSPPPK